MVKPLKESERSLLFEIAFLFRRYEIGDENDFVNKISQIKKIQTAHLNEVWKTAMLKVKNEKIVKDAKNISESEEKSYKKDAIKILVDNSNDSIKEYLFSDFDPKQYKLDAEKKIRRIRHLIAEAYVNKLLLKYQSEVDSEKKGFVRRIIYYTIAVNITFITLSVFLLFPLYRENSNYNKQVSEWRKNGIATSPIVCETSSGNRYHRCYHYKKRNSSLSLFEAVIDKKLTPCGTCNPPKKNFGNRPKRRYPNPFLISIFPIVILISGNLFAKRRLKEHINKSFF